MEIAILKQTDFHHDYSRAEGNKFYFMLSRKRLDVLVRAAHRQQRLQHLGRADGPAQCNEAFKKQGKLLLQFGNRSKAGSTPGVKRVADKRVQ